jgi:hypothetical protein
VSFLAAFAKLRKVTMSYVMSACLSVCPSAWNILAPTGRSFVKFDARVFSENPSRKFKLLYSLTRITVIVRKELGTFLYRT